MNSQNILVRNNVKILGQGQKPILFAHGFGCDQNMWRFVTPAFESEYKVILFDYVGSGKSDLSAYSIERYSNLSGYAQDILEICDSLALQKIIFAGHSVSSVIGMLASIQYPDLFEQLILVCPSPCYINDKSNNYIGGFERSDVESLLDIMEKNYIGWASFLAPMIVQNENQPELIQELTTSFCSTDPVIANCFAKATFYSDNRSDLPKVTIPSLTLQCSDDAIAPIEVGYYLHDHLYQNTLKIMKATGHCPHMSHPQETISLIQQYLRNLE
ncbi:alpha/beta hydrolase [Geminocystis sp. GBBB08]|uniref:alpha/beta fold hydrolase n=1 Tax=Geminocystis sp. GBBB08 TaxID=2604140 RepID=UPI0027E288CB|nr:alpha/beta hydrolase [Geminocystis sp. GBBB08]MBL1210510.1 alpha/beta hydrolase [Geminocystis sp. GBBB08]